MVLIGFWVGASNLSTTNLAGYYLGVPSCLGRAIRYYSSSLHSCGVTAPIAHATLQGYVQFGARALIHHPNLLF